MLGGRTIAVVGSINMDLAVRTPRVPLRGENLLARSLAVGLGGKGGNPSVALCRMGARALLVACLGQDDFGQQAMAALQSDGVDLSAVSMLPGVDTGVALIMVDDEGENTILVVIGANNHLTAERVEASLAPHWGTLDAVLVNFEIPAAAVAAAIRAGRAHAVPVVVDAGPPRAFGPEVWGDATVLLPNEIEAETLTGCTITDDAAAVEAVLALRARGPEAVVLKWGARGALVATADGVERVPGFAVDVVDTTGAGDAFSAALTLALAEGRSLPEAVRFANAAGAVAVTRMGARVAMPTRVDVETLLRQSRTP